MSISIRQFVFALVIVSLNFLVIGALSMTLYRSEEVHNMRQINQAHLNDKAWMSEVLKQSSRLEQGNAEHEKQWRDLVNRGFNVPLYGPKQLPPPKESDGSGDGSSEE